MASGMVNKPLDIRLYDFTIEFNNTTTVTYSISSINNELSFARYLSVFINNQGSIVEITRNAAKNYITFSCLSSL